MYIYIYTYIWLKSMVNVGVYIYIFILHTWSIWVVFFLGGGDLYVQGLLPPIQPNEKQYSLDMVTWGRGFHFMGDC